MTDTKIKIGKCPICDITAQVIKSAREIEGPHKKLCSNEYYTHYIDPMGIDYIKKRSDPKYPVLS